MSPDKQKMAILESILGKEQVICPELGAKRTLTLFAMGFGLLILLMFTVVILTFWKSNMVAGVASVLALALVGVLVFFLAGRGVTHLLVRQAAFHAELAFKKFRPNVIVASSLGAVVALQMDTPKVPLVRDDRSPTTFQGICFWLTKMHHWLH